MDNFQLTLLQPPPPPPPPPKPPPSLPPIQKGFLCGGRHQGGRMPRDSAVLGHFWKVANCWNVALLSIISPVMSSPSTNTAHKSVAVPSLQGSHDSGGGKMRKKYLAEITPSGTKHIIKLHFLVLNTSCTCRVQKVTQVLWIFDLLQTSG